MATSSNGLLATNPTAPPTPRPSKTWRRPYSEKMRERIERISCQTLEGKDRKLHELFRFDLMRNELMDLMSQDGFFPGFTEAQKLWYIDAALYDRFILPQTVGGIKFQYSCPPDSFQLSPMAEKPGFGKPTIKKEKKDGHSMDESVRPWSEGSRWGASPKQPILPKPVTSIKTEDGTPQISLKDISIHGNTVQPVPREAKTASASPNQGNSSKDDANEQDCASSADGLGKTQASLGVLDDSGPKNGQLIKLEIEDVQ
ncbi:hypothetical protein ONS95_000195 [Cadophora gregata]|uniref:uncharacterized protein n=1 Tax=Cadophora gregata TaxID=51156 RepID=UPI0026DAEA2F|nr:uncharacterized protein ONS95_000195 [Cadophora gregata]KAK0115526.1 hypothetical protein ONS96_013980 [Cadophora gregata f. sp. sojae]KAK0128218.1 hypothetical protein ONS95_000195 [Cadophora gregata]